MYLDNFDGVTIDYPHERRPGALSNIGYPSDNAYLGWLMDLNFCTEYCRALCKSTNRLNNWNGPCGRTQFPEIWVEYACRLYPIFHSTPVHETRSNDILRYISTTTSHQSNVISLVFVLAYSCAIGICICKIKTIPGENYHYIKLWKMLQIMQICSY